MQQGKLYLEEQKVELLQVIRNYLESGQSRNYACIMAGISPSTLSRWLQNDDTLAMKVATWESNLNYLARANIAKSIQNNDVNTSKWYLEKTDGSFSTKHLVRAELASYPKTRELAVKDSRVAKTIITSLLLFVESLTEDDKVQYIKEDDEYTR